MVGNQYLVQNQQDQKPLLAKVMRSEKLIVYALLSFVLLIATFNLVGALLMLALEKRKDMAILLTMGATQQTLRSIILYEGLLLSLVGGLLGLGIGALLCWLQIKYGFVTLGSTNSTFVINQYPIALKLSDFIVVLVTLVVLGLLSSYLPARIAARRIRVEHLRER